MQSFCYSYIALFTILCMLGSHLVCSLRSNLLKAHRLTFSLDMSTTNPSRTPIHPSQLTIMPELIVFDLDQCIWHPEMYTLSEIPTKTKIGDLNGLGDGVNGVISDYETIKLFPDALNILQQIYLGSYGDIKIAAASSADTPHAVAIGKAAMQLLESMPGVTMRAAFARGWPEGFSGNMQIGRTPPLSSDKSKTHFPILRAETGLDYSKMIFFDDCTWGDHCTNVAQNCQGVITQRTPYGLQISEWNAALRKYDQTYGIRE